jgi:hypothetical protein
MTELKGKIKVDGTKSITCCDSISNVLVGEIELYYFILELCGLDSPTDDDDYYTNEVVRDWQIQYCTSNTEFVEETFEECSANKVMEMLYSSEIVGCYSSWTCGSGGYDFLVSNKEGHSLFQELASFDGQYVWISFGESKVEISK